MRMLGQSTRSSLIIGGSLAQIGEFSIIVAGLGVSLGLFTHDTQSKVVPAALIAITVNQSTLAGASRMLARSDEETARRRMSEATEYHSGQPVPSVPLTARATRVPMEAVEDPFDFSRFRDHVVVIGHGRVGTTIRTLRLGYAHAARRSRLSSKHSRMRQVRPVAPSTLNAKRRSVLRTTRCRHSAAATMKLTWRLRECKIHASRRRRHWPRCTRRNSGR